MPGMQSGFRSWGKGGNRRMEESRGRERQRSQLGSVCAGRSACLAARCLPEIKQASDYDMNINFNVDQRRAWLWTWSRSQHCPESPPEWTSGSCRSSWHTQKPPAFPAVPCPWLALLWLCVFSNSSHLGGEIPLILSGWLNCFVGSSESLHFKFEACFCLYHNLKEGNVGMDKADRQFWLSAWVRASSEWHNPSTITVRRLWGSGPWRYVSLDTKKIDAHVKGALGAGTLRSVEVLLKLQLSSRRLILLRFY